MICAHESDVGSFQDANVSLSIYSPTDNFLDGLSQHDILAISFDYRCSIGAGYALMRLARHKRQDLPIIAIANPTEGASWREALELGDLTVLRRPLTSERVNESVEALKSQRTFRLSLLRSFAAAGVVGQSRTFAYALGQLASAIHTKASLLLITGQPGTGKSLFAELFYRFSDFVTCDFIKIDCRRSKASPFDPQVNSDVVWHLKGGEYLSADSQDECFKRNVSRMNGDRNDAIVISTCCDVRPLVRRGHFLADLFYACEARITLPQLVDREVDLDLAIDNFVTSMGVAGCSAEARELMHHASFPGNFHQLNAVLRKASAASRHKEIRPEHLPLSLLFVDDMSERDEKHSALFELPLDEAIRKFTKIYEANVENAGKEAVEFEGNPSDKEAMLRQLLGAESEELLRIVEDSGKTVHDRMKAVCSFDRRFLGYKSEEWATILGVSAQAVRRTEAWKEIQRQKRISD